MTYEPTEPLNLDCEDDATLREVVASGDAPPRIRAYAEGVIEARAHRLAGRIQSALDVERALDRIYRHIPESLRW